MTRSDAQGLWIWNGRKLQAPGSHGAAKMTIVWMVESPHQEAKRGYCSRRIAFGTKKWIITKAVVKAKAMRRTEMQFQLSKPESLPSYATIQLQIQNENTNSQHQHHSQRHKHP